MSATVSEADEAVTELYASHYQRLVRTAALLVRNSGEAEEIVQDAFVTMHGRWSRLSDQSKAAGYLHRTVVNAARSSQRHHAVADRYASRLLEDRTADGTDAAIARRDVLDALEGLPTRQREVLVLRYYTDLSEAEIADALRISRGSVKSHASRGITALRSLLEETA